MKKVLLIDSGSGGVNVLKECLRACPCCDYLLLCDDKNLPYGTKNQEELLRLTIANLEKVFEFFKFEVVIFACNTLTAVCLQECKKKFAEIEFFGIEPMVEDALEDFCAQEVLVLATSNTIKFCDKLRNFKGVVLCIDNLASEIDKSLDCLWRLQPFLEEKLNEFRGKIKAVVLGCTHYVAVKDLIKLILGDVVFFDGATAVAENLRQTLINGEKDVLKINENGVLLPNFKVQIMTSGSQERRNQFLWWLNRE